MKTEFLSETLVIKSLARRERRRGVKASLPINVRVNVLDSKNNQGKYKLGITNVDNPSQEKSGKAKLGFSYSINPILFH